MRTCLAGPSKVEESREEVIIVNQRFQIYQQIIKGLVQCTANNFHSRPKMVDMPLTSLGVQWPGGSG